MSSALSLDIDSIKSLYVDKPRWTFVLGNYLAVFFLPFHMLGFILVYEAITPVGQFKAFIFLGGAFYFVAVRTGFHGTFAFIANTIQSGDALVVGKMFGYWTVWGIVLVLGYAVLCIYLIALNFTGKTLYPITTILITPPVFFFLERWLFGCCRSDSVASRPSLPLLDSTFCYWFSTVLSGGSCRITPSHVELNKLLTPMRQTRMIQLQFDRSIFFDVSFGLFC